MAKQGYSFSERFPHFKLFLTLAFLIAIPLTVWSINNVSTTTSQHASSLPSYFYCQYDKSWSTSSCHVNNYGCSPTAIAMVLSRFVSNSYSPYQVAKAMGSGCNIPTSISNMHNAMVNYVAGKGLVVVENSLITKYKTSFNYELAKQHIESGYLIIATGCMKFSGGAGAGDHSIVITSVNTTNHKMTVLDPTSCSAIRSFDGDTDILNSSSCDYKGWISTYAVGLPNTKSNKAL